jgi:hypothetical protein
MSLPVEKDKSWKQMIEGKYLRSTARPCWLLAAWTARSRPERGRTSHLYIYLSSAGAYAPLVKSLAMCLPADKEELQDCSAKNGDLELRKWIT